MVETWKSIMVDRDFHVDKTVVRYGAGQPMGFYSSWASFTLAHHALIQYLAFKEGFKSFDEYQVLGDDVVIWEERVANSYKRAMSGLGVSINLSKSLISEQSHTRIEFAKRLFYNGEEITPIGYKLLKVVGKSLFRLPILLQELQQKGWKLNGEDLDLCPGSPNQKGYELLFLLSKSPLGRWLNMPPEIELTTMPPIKGGHNCAETWSTIRNRFLRIRGKQLEKRALDLLDDTGSLIPVLKKYLPEGGLFEETILNSLQGSQPAHPAPYVLQLTEDKIYEVMRKISNMRETRVDLTELIPQMIEYVPSPLEESLERDIRIMETDFTAKL
jgi:hypothetical protein